VETTLHHGVTCSPTPCCSTSAHEACRGEAKRDTSEQAMHNLRGACLHAVTKHVVPASYSLPRPSIPIHSSYSITESCEALNRVAKPWPVLFIHGHQVSHLTMGLTHFCAARVHPGESNASWMMKVGMREGETPGFIHVQHMCAARMAALSVAAVSSLQQCPCKAFASAT
jgi:hypothetical protein